MKTREHEKRKKERRKENCNWCVTFSFVGSIFYTSEGGGGEHPLIMADVGITLPPTWGSRRGEGEATTFDKVLVPDFIYTLIFYVLCTVSAGRARYREMSLVSSLFMRLSRFVFKMPLKPTCHSGPTHFRKRNIFTARLSRPTNKSPVLGLLY